MKVARPVRRGTVGIAGYAARWPSTLLKRIGGADCVAEYGDCAMAGGDSVDAREDELMNF